MAGYPLVWVGRDVRGMFIVGWDGVDCVGWGCGSFRWILGTVFQVIHMLQLSIMLSHT